MPESETTAPSPVAGATAASAGVAVAAGLSTVDPDVLFWASWGSLLLALGIGVFALREIPAYFGPGLTLSEVVEAAIAAHRPLYFILLLALGILGAGFGVLLPLHWYTAIL